MLASAGGLLQLNATRGNAMQANQDQLTQAKIAAEAQNKFAMELLKLEAAESPGKNVFISPTSIFLALAMTEGGAAGKTRAAMRHTLAIPDSTTDDALAASAAALSAQLHTRRNVELSIANALWSDNSFPFAPAFVKKSRELYGADVTNLDFTKANATADAINNWVRSKTKEKIPTIVTPDIIAKAKAVLTNTIYFQGAWRDKFKKELTTPGTFTMTRGHSKEVPFMHQSHLRGAYRPGSGFEAAVLPYMNSGIAMCALLPSPGKTPEQALAKVSIDKLMSFDSDELEIKLPRFTTEFSTKLKSPLTRMGMGIAFQYPGAEFTPLGSPLFYIGEVLHKAKLEVDEEGTVAASATAVMTMVGSAAPQKVEKRLLVFDRPFAVLLCDGATNAILFAGIINEP